MTSTASRSRQPKGVSTGGQFATETKSEATGVSIAPETIKPELLVPVEDRETEPGHYTGRPLLIDVAPDYEVGAGGYRGTDWRNAVHVDIAPLLADDPDLRDGLIWAMNEDHGSLSNEVGDSLAELSGALEQINGNAGYSVAASNPNTQSTLEWLDDNPAWVEDGKTPHPSGGYARVSNGIDPDTGEGTITHYDADGRIHREDGPAMVSVSRGLKTEIWMRHGTAGREGAPVLQQTHQKSGRIVAQEWHKDGALHREDGPAMIGKDGSRTWFVDGRPTHSQPGISDLGEGAVVSLDGQIIPLTGPHA